ncbi:hypothetical protein Tco_0611657 [Tanacetum coccineum]
MKTLLTDQTEGEKRTDSKDAETTKREPEFEVQFRICHQVQEKNLVMIDLRTSKERKAHQSLERYSFDFCDSTSNFTEAGYSKVCSKIFIWLVKVTDEDQRTALTSFVDKPSKTFDELMISPIDFSAYIMNGLKITNLTQETLLGPAFKLLKGTRTNFAELEYDFEECYKALLKKLD